MGGAMEKSLVDRLLNAMLEPQNMADALRAIASEFSADHLFAHLVSPEITDSFVSRDSEELLSLLFAWGPMNPRLERAMDFTRRGEHGLLTDWRLFTPQEIACDPFEQEFTHKHGLVHYAGSVIPFSPDSFLVLSFERGFKRGAYGGLEEQSIERFLEECAIALRYAWRGQVHLTHAMINSQTGDGAAHAWVDGTARLIHASPAFEALIDRFLGERNGYLVPLSGDAENFQELIRRVASGERNFFTVELCNPAEPAELAVVRAFPLRTMRLLACQTADVLLSFEVSTAGRADVPRTLDARYSLTPAEIRLTIRLSEGKSLRQAAYAENISYESARTRLKSIFAKMAVSRQSELVRLICSL